MPSLNINKVLLRNFRSYGDYDTEVDLNNLGPVLIIGEITENPSKSNGAGKSTIADAIVWCLFGRLPYKQKPASYVVNHSTGKDCLVQITTTDGYTITRTRNFENHNDLLIKQPNGEDITDSTNTNAQQHLNRLFDLDYDIFCSNVFFAQFGQPFMELPDLKRKKALERMLHLDRMDFFAEVAKEKITKLTTEQAKFNGEYDTTEREIIKDSEQIERNIDLLNEYEKKRDDRVKQQRTRFATIDQEFEQKAIILQQTLNEERDTLAKIVTYDIDNLKILWDKHQQKLAKLEKVKTSIQRMKNTIAGLRAEQEALSLQEEAEDLDEQIRSQEDKRNTLTEIDLNDIGKQWKEYEANQTLIAETEAKCRQANAQLIKFRSDLEADQRYIDKWLEKANTTCPTCGQDVPEKHTHKMSAPHQTRIAELEQDITKIKNTITKLEGAKARVTLVTPERSLSEATLINESITNITKNIESLRLRQASEKQRDADRVQHIKEVDEEIERKCAYVENKSAELDLTIQKVDQAKPSATIKEAEALKSQYDTQLREITRREQEITNLSGQKEQAKDQIRADIKAIQEEPNPYNIIVEEQKKALEETKLSRDKLKSKIEQLDKLIKYTEYIRSAYSDRRKIKSHLLSRLIPFFNERIAYYLDMMECNCVLRFTSALQTKYDFWPYEMWSGGERKRIDLALMFAIHDLHTSIYEQQCNLLVFDEVDGRLDDEGVYRFTEILFDELSGKDSNKSTILVISHEDTMKDMIPTKILVRKDKASIDGCSHIEEIR